MFSVVTRRGLILIALCCVFIFAAATGMAQAPQEGAAEAAAEAAHVTPPEPSAKAMRYYQTGNWIWLASQLLTLAVPALIVFTGFSAKMRDGAYRLGRYWLFALWLYFIAFVLINYAIDLPFSYFFGYLRQHAYDLSNQSFGKWLGDSLKSLGVTVFVGCLLIWIPFLLLRKAPARWWIFCGLLAFPLIFLGIMVAPLFIAPLFNDFGPMQDKALEAKILALADRAGIEGSDVYEVNKSVDTKAMNAYVTGLGDTKRIVLWDTIIAKMEDAELLFVMAHEMGHYVLGHVWKTVLFMGTLLFISLYIVHRLSHALIRRFGGRFRFHTLDDFAALPLLLLVLNMVTLLAMPMALAYSRYNEREADRFGIELTQDSAAAARGFIKLQTENLANPDPGPLFQWWRGSHPSIAQRVDFFNTYTPWLTGEDLVYGHYFTNAPQVETPDGE